MDDTQRRDDEVLHLRTQGKSFAGIAKTLGLSRPSQANEAFNRALRRRPVGEQDALRQRESARLDTLIAGVQANSDLAPEQRARRLRSVERLRARLLAD